LLELKERHGFVHDIFPPASHQKFIDHLTKNEATVYAGFDPTSDSLHVGNLMVIMALLHAQRGGHQAIGLVGGATAKIGDPSGKSSEREAIGDDVISKNVEGLKRDLNAVFKNHQELFLRENAENGGKFKPLKIVDNMEWYNSINVIEFLRQFGRHFRMNKMLSRDSVKTRLDETDGGLSFTEFTYQVFQAYDWYHLLKQHGCTVQIGAVDQMGNIATGHEFITRYETEVGRKKGGGGQKRAVNPTYGLMLPLITTQGGKKVGKSEGNAAVWLSPEKTSPFDFYQYFLRVEDSDVEKFLNFYTFLPASEIRDLVANQAQFKKRAPHRKLAEQVTLLVHGEAGLRSAHLTTKLLYESEDVGETLASLSKPELKLIFAQAPHLKFLSSPTVSVLDLAKKLQFFKNEKDAVDTISKGGFYLNQIRRSRIDEILVPGIHILPNDLTLVRVGKRNYFIVEWTDF